jgi:hypothetical protein
MERRRKSDKEITDVALAARVARVVDIHTVLLREAHLRSAFDPDKPPDKLIPHQQIGANHSLSEAGALRVVINFTLELKPEAKDDTPVIPALEVKAQYEVVYQLPKEASFSDKELGHFAELNGTVNLWPYWRELVHTVAARIGMGSITLPVYRVKPKVVEVLETTEAKKA